MKEEGKVQALVWCLSAQELCEQGGGLDSHDDEVMLNVLRCQLTY